MVDRDTEAQQGAGHEEAIVESIRLLAAPTLEDGLNIVVKDAALLAENHRAELTRFQTSDPYPRALKEWSTTLWSLMPTKTEG